MPHHNLHPCFHPLLTKTSNAAPPHRRMPHIMLFLLLFVRHAVGRQVVTLSPHNPLNQ